MEIINELPVLILAYNRFDKFFRCINNVYEQGIKKVYVSIDGPLNYHDLENQKKIYDYCKYNSLNLDITTNCFNKNNGCRLGPIKGISWFFKNNIFGVVLEDDVIVSKKCMEIFLHLLKKNISSEKYMSISSFYEFSNENIESIYSIPVWRSWGWATWADKWEMHINFSEKISNYNLWQLYHLMPKELKSIETANIIKSCQLNFLDAWDYEFNFSHLVHHHNSLTIGGINNYVYGFDKSATHTFNLDSIGIDFSFFKERDINESVIKKLDYSESSIILKKCGFNYLAKQSKLKLLNNTFKVFFYTLILYLRILKRNLNSRLRNN